MRQGKPTTVSEEFCIDKKTLDKLGVYDSFLNFDTRLFIHPDLLKKTKILELKESHNKILKHFSAIIKLLSHSKSSGDLCWRNADKLFTFPELEGLCIGYASQGTGGSGMGAGFRAALLKTGKELIELGITDPEIFELIGLFEEGIGCDRISDMIGRIISEDLLSFTDRVFKQVGLPKGTSVITVSGYTIPINRFNNKSIILLPKDILDELPEAFSRDDIGRICSKNEELRKRLNTLLASKCFKNNYRPSKSDLRDFFFRNPDVFKAIIEAYKNGNRPSYNFDDDPAGEIHWYPVAVNAVKQHPLSIKLNATPAVDDVDQVVKTICLKFKEIVEDNGLWKFFYDKVGGKPRYERAAQLLFFAVATSYCEANGLDLSPEADGGQGPVDFKVSKGFNGRVLVEVKLTTNRQLLHGFSKQLPVYEKAEKTDRSKYLVIDFGHPEVIKRLYVLKNTLATKTNHLPEIIVVDAKPKKSASKVK